MQGTQTAELSYAGFIARFLALVLDSVLLAIVMSPFALLVLMVMDSLAMQVVLRVSVAVVALAYEIVFLAIWGQTAGKMFCSVKVTRTDGGPIGYRQACVRTSPYIVLTAAWLIGLWSILPAWGDPLWWTADDAALRAAGLQVLDRWPPMLAIASTIWFWTEVIVMCCNKQRRALHDFIAGTVAVRHRPGRGLGYTLNPRPGDPV